MSYVKQVWTNTNDPNRIPISADHLNHMEDGIEAALRKDGGTMTGNLMLNGAPTQTNQAATKGYVDEGHPETIFLHIKTNTTIPANSTNYIEIGAIPNYNNTVGYLSLYSQMSGNTQNIPLCFYMPDNDKNLFCFVPFKTYDSYREAKMKIDSNGVVFIKNDSPQDMTTDTLFYPLVLIPMKYTTLTYNE